MTLAAIIQTKPMAIKKTDFHSIFIEEGEPYYDEIFSLDKDKFNDWITVHFNEVKTINSFKNVVPSIDCITEFRKLGYKHIASQCHYSAKAISLLNADYQYWTGFIHRQDFFYPIVTHSFNLYGKSIIDFARINNNLKVIKVDTPYFPHIYYGINIPNEFLKQFKEETFNNKSMKPLLFEWYKENNC